MRDIRFRAWDKKLKKMITEGFSVTYCGAPCDLHGHLARDHSDEDILRGDGGIVLMQYTGLHDKNGAEIYESDLIQNESGRICAVLWWFYKGSWDAMCCRNAEETDARGFSVNEWSRSVEVIGNIHANPELTIEDPTPIAKAKGT